MLAKFSINRIMAGRDFFSATSETLRSMAICGMIYYLKTKFMEKIDDLNKPTLMNVQRKVTKFGIQPWFVL